MEMRARSTTEVVRMMPSPTATILATTASRKDMARVSSNPASMFCPMRLWRRRENRKRPAWMAVESRLPRAENTLPRRPMAAGTSTSRPGNSLKVPVIDPSAAPATKLVVLLSMRAMRL